MPVGPALADNSELCASIVLPFAKYSIFDFPMFYMKNVWRKSVVSPKTGNIFKKFPVLGETLLYLQQ